MTVWDYLFFDNPQFFAPVSRAKQHHCVETMKNHFMPLIRTLGDGPGKFTLFAFAHFIPKKRHLVRQYPYLSLCGLSVCFPTPDVITPPHIHTPAHAGQTHTRMPGSTQPTHVRIQCDGVGARYQCQPHRAKAPCLRSSLRPRCSPVDVVCVCKMDGSPHKLRTVSRCHRHCLYYAEQRARVCMQLPPIRRWTYFTKIIVAVSIHLVQIPTEFYTHWTIDVDSHVRMNEYESFCSSVFILRSF